MRSAWSARSAIHAMQSPFRICRTRWSAVRVPAAGLGHQSRQRGLRPMEERHELGALLDLATPRSLASHGFASLGDTVTDSP
jgi:hypothetical protein